MYRQSLIIVELKQRGDKDTIVLEDADGGRFETRGQFSKRDTPFLKLNIGILVLYVSRFARKNTLLPDVSKNNTLTYT